MDISDCVYGFTQLWSYARQLLGIKLYLTLMIFTLASITEGIGITLLLPLLDHVLQTSSEASSSLIAAIEYGVFAATGVTSPAMIMGIGVIVIILRIILGGISHYSITKIRYDTVISLRTGLLNKLAKSKWTYLSRIPHGSSLQHLIHSTATSGEAVNEAAQIITRGLVILTHIGIAMMLSWPLTLLIITVLSVVALTGRRSVKKSEELGRKLRTRQHELYTDTLNIMQAARTMKMSGHEARWCDNFLQHQNKTNTQILAFTKIELFTRLLFQFTGLATVVFFTVMAVFFFQTPLPHVLVFALISARLFPLVQTGAHEIQRFYHHLPSFAYVMKEIKAAEDHAEPPGERPGNLDKPVGAPEIKLKDVSLTSQKNPTQTLLNSLELTLKAGEITALAGASGAGKSLTADILSGLIEPDHGSVEIGGTKLEATNRTIWRHQVGYVPQDPVMLNISLRDNLRLAKPDVGDEEIIKTLKLAHLTTLLSTLRDGLDTNVGERGVLLSGGERQRIALARELLNKPGLLILDEATSGLDPVSSQYITETLQALRNTMTILIISHRLATLKIADSIYVMDRGRIVEQGCWHKLTGRKNGRLQQYQELEA